MNNSALALGSEGQYYAYGGGICCLTSQVEITNCVVSENLTRSYNIGHGYARAYGGGIYLLDCTAQITASEFNYNTIYTYTTGTTYDSAYALSYGGGVYSENSKTDLLHCTANHNTSEAYAYCCGSSGSSHSESPSSESEYSPDDGGEGSATYCQGGGIYIKGARNTSDAPFIKNCLVCDNTYQCDGGKGWVHVAGAGGIHLAQPDNSPRSPAISNCTIANNSKRGLDADYAAYLTVKNCIIWGNEGDIDGVTCNRLYYCDIGDGSCAGEQNNISEDPLFLGGYYLSQTAAGQSEQSPCVDAGNYSASSLDLDDRTTRTDGVPDGGIVDMGYHYFTDVEYTAPVLSNGKVDPESGTLSTEFTYSVHYYQAEGSAPSPIKVFIDSDEGHNMTLNDGDSSDGTYIYRTTLAEGEHTFYFYCVNGHGDSDADPDSGSYDGPSVSGKGGEYYVDKTYGSDSNSGESWGDAFATIQKGIDACTTGTETDPDFVHVAAETYYENVHPDDYMIILGGYPVGGGERNWQANWTSIDGSDAGSVVTLNGDENVRIDGFTIVNGKANYGGGIFCDNSKVELLNCTIRDNLAYKSGTSTQTAHGGGLYSTASVLTLINCTILNNQAKANTESYGYPEGKAYTYGGGVYLTECHASFVDCAVRDNETYANSSSYIGYADNAYARGGGIYSKTSSPTLIHTQVVGNRSYARAHWQGSYSDSDDGDADFSPSCGVGNRYASSIGGGIFIQDAVSRSIAPVLRNCLVAENIVDTTISRAYSSKYEKAGGLFFSMSNSYYSAPKLSNCTIANNTHEGIYATDYSRPTLIDSIIWGNADDVSGFVCANLSYCDIEDGDCEGSSGNISEDPIFVESYHLSQKQSGQSTDSPCLDSGSDYALSIGLADRSTRTDSMPDLYILDRGWHYPSTKDNHNPVLSGGRVSPENGTENTEFTFQVHYRDVDGDSPSLLKVYISDDGGHDMTFDSGYAHDGDYSFKTKLSQGDHVYYFYCEDGDDGKCREPATDSHKGPFVDGDTSLSNGTIDPGSGYSSTTFRYSVDYYDADGYAPSIKLVYIDYDSGHEMTLDSGTASNGTYIYETTLPSGQHNMKFHFENENGRGDSEPFVGVYEGPFVNDPPVLSAPNVDPKEGTTCRHYKYTVHYYDPEGSSPSVAKVILDGEYEHDMALDSGNAEDGTYSFRTTLDDGEHTYYFYFEDEYQNSAREPENEAYVEPDVTYDPQCDFYVHAIYGNDDNSGLSWDDAFASIQAGVDACIFGTEDDPDVIHVSEGKYYEHLELNDHIILLGGYPYGGGTRGTGTSSTIIDGGGSEKVIYIDGDDDITLDGITIANGYVVGMGGGILHYYAGSLTLIDCTIENCFATSGGGAIYSRGDGALTLIDCLLSGNDTRASGGGIWCYGAGARTFTNCLFIDNTADSYGGPIYTFAECSPVIMNCTIEGNEGEEGGGGVNCYSSTCEPVILNSILWGNTPDEIGGECENITVTYSDIEGGWEGEGNIDEDPLFTEGYHLSQTAAGESEQSPCADAGDDSASEYGMDDYTTRTDQAEDDGMVDMGYHYFPEYSGPKLSTPSFSPDSGQTDTQFTFYVTYFSAEGYAPSTIEVVINENPQSMELDTGDAGDGVYSWTGTIDTEGLAQYYMICEDGHSGSDRIPSQGAIDGPYIANDYDAPQSSCTTPDRTRSSAIEVQYTSSDEYSGVQNVALLMQFNDGGFYEIDTSEDVNGTFDVLLGNGNGNYAFYTIATDHAGNVEEPPGTSDCTTLYDDTPPSSSVSSGGYSNSTPFIIEFTASDAVSGVKTTTLWFSFEDGTWTDSGLTSDEEAGAFNFDAADGEGEYAFYTICEDENGNVEDAPATADGIFVFETNKPESSCACNETTNQSWVNVDYEASDDHQIDEMSLWYAFEGCTWTDSGLTGSGESGRIVFSFTNGDGIYSFYTIARDSAGNVEEAPGAADDSVEADFTPPESTCWIDDDSTNSLPFAVNFTASDAYSGLKYTLLYYRFSGESDWIYSGISDSGESGILSLDPTAITPEYGDGTYEVMTLATDNFDNDESPSAPDDAFILDRTPPTSSLSCPQWTGTSPVAVDYSASDALTGITQFSLWYRFSGGDWQDTGHSSSAAEGSFDVSLPYGDGVYEFAGAATDGAGNTETPTTVDASCAFDTTPPVCTARVDAAVNDTTIGVEYEATDTLTPIANVHLYYRYTDLEGGEDDTLRDTGEESGEAYGLFDWAADMGPGYYDFYLSAKDEAGNTESTDGEPDATCLYDPRLALSSVEGPEFVTEEAIALDFEIDIGNDGYDCVTLYYRYGVTLEAAEAEDWAETEQVSSEEMGEFDFTCASGQGYYQFCTKARNDSGLIEPAPSFADTTTLFDATAPQTSVTAPVISISSEFDLAFTSTESYEVKSIDIYYWFDGDWSLFTTVYEDSGTVQFSAQGVEGEYRFYSVGIDEAGNEESAPAAGYDCSVLVDLNPPESAAAASAYGNAFPIEVTFSAGDAVTQIAEVVLWAKCEGGEWFDTGLSGDGDSGSLQFTPSESVEGRYYFYTIATDEAGYVEEAPVSFDCSTIIDWTPPETDCTSPDYTNDGTIELAYSAEDSLSGIASVEAWIKVGSEAWTSAGASGGPHGDKIYVDVSSLGEGMYGLCTRGRDNSGNLEALPQTIPTKTIYDCTAPSSAASLPSQGVYANSAPIDIPYSASDSLSGLSSVELWFSFDGGEWEDSGLSISASGLHEDEVFAFMPPNGDGTYRFATTAADNAGNTEALPGSPDGGALVFDRIAPSSSVSYPSAYASGFPLIIPFEASDDSSGIFEVSLWVSVNGSAYSDAGLTNYGLSGSFSFTPGVVTDGIYSFYSLASDRAGNAEAVPGAPDTIVTFDLDAPISSASSDSEYSSFPILVDFNASDTASGVAEVSLWVSFNGGAFVTTGLSSQEASGTFSYAPVSTLDGVYAFYTIAWDEAGNAEQAKTAADVSVMVDRIAPKSSCSIEHEYGNSAPIKVDYTSSDSGSGIGSVRLYSRFEGGSWSLVVKLTEAAGSYNFTPAPLKEGTYEFYTRAYDKASNAESLSGADDGIEIDLTAPNSSASAPESATELPISVYFAGRDTRSAVESVRLWYRVDDGEWLDSGLQSEDSDGIFEFDCPDGPGLYALYTIATDIAGNIEAAPSTPDAECDYHLPAPHISASPDHLDFGEVGVGLVRERNVLIENVGFAPLTVESVELASSAFEVEYEAGFPETVGAEESIAVTVRFSPDDFGEYEAELTVNSDDPEFPSIGIPLSGIGTLGELVMSVSASAAEFEFDDTLDLSVGCTNSGIQRCVDVYLVLTFDLGGPAERHWSSTFYDGWQEGLLPLLSGLNIGSDFDFNALWWNSSLPCGLPQITETGTYTVRMAAFDTATFDLASNVAVDEFTLTGMPFVGVSSDDDTYWFMGDTAHVWLDFRLPRYETVADLVVVVLSPEGTFYSPFGHGTNVNWQAGVIPLYEGYSMDESTIPGVVSWEIGLPGNEPFDMAGEFRFFAAFVRPGTISPQSDIGTHLITLQ
ncbi:MAG: right-handed parallel beta-helix repeat-containing protein [Candidatus Coatesbacteria bacterium]|nr:right-handed parallel beta-helix repeat-containing protein [Candidatus Coatesbacteria bacterium]